MSVIPSLFGYALEVAAELESVPVDGEQQSANATGDFKILKILRMLRLAKLLRLSKMQRLIVKYADELGSMTAVFKLLGIIGVVLFLSHGSCCW